MPQPGLALVLFVLGAGALVLLAWPSWGIVARLHYTLVAVAALYFFWYLNAVNILF